MDPFTHWLLYTPMGNQELEEGLPYDEDFKWVQTGHNDFGHVAMARLARRAGASTTIFQAHITGYNRLPVPQGPEGCT